MWHIRCTTCAQAKREREFGVADGCRSQLQALGVHVDDKTMAWKVSLGSMQLRFNAENGLAQLSPGLNCSKQDRGLEGVQGGGRRAIGAPTAARPASPSTHPRVVWHGVRGSARDGCAARWRAGRARPRLHARRRRLREGASRQGAPWDVVTRDYRPILIRVASDPKGAPAAGRARRR